MKFKRAFTFIELIMVIAIIGILAGSGAWLMFYTIKNSVFIPNQLNMDKLANDALNIMIEGDSQAKGLRFSKSIGPAITATRVDFIDGNNNAVTFELVGNRLLRTVNGVTANIPSYLKDTGLDSSVILLGPLFTYYNSSEGAPAIAADVRRIKIILIAQSGTGGYNNWQGNSAQTTSITVDKLQ